MLPYEKKLARSMIRELTDKGYFDEFGRTVNHICSTSVDDAYHTIKECTSTPELEACLFFEKSAHSPRKTLMTRIWSRIKKLKKEITNVR